MGHVVGAKGWFSENTRRAESWGSAGGGPSCPRPAPPAQVGWRGRLTTGLGVSAPQPRLPPAPSPPCPPPLPFAGSLRASGPLGTALRSWTGDPSCALASAPTAADVLRFLSAAAAAPLDLLRRDLQPGQAPWTVPPAA